MLEYGLRLGLAADMQYDKRIQDLRYNEEAKRRAQNEAEAKAQLYANDFAYTNAMNTHDNPLVKQYAQFQIKRIGNFINSNPDWKTNVAKRAEYNNLIHELKDNPDLNRGLQTDKAFEELNNFAKDPKNAGIVNSERWKKQVLDKKNNYLLFGNENGEEAAKKEGKKAFMFKPPVKLDTEKIVTDAANELEYRARNLTRKDYAGEIGRGATIEDVTFDRAYQNAHSLLQDDDKSIEFQEEWSGMSDNTKQIYSNDIANWVAKRIQTKKGSKIDTGQHDVAKTGSGSGSGLPDATFHYIEEVYKQKSGSTPYINAVLPLKFDAVKGQHTYKPSPKGINMLIDNNGKEEIVNLPGILPSVDYQASGSGQFKEFNGVKYGEVKLRVPLNKNMTVGPNALFKSNSWNIFEGDLEKDNYDEMPSMNGIANIEVDKEGNRTGYGIITTWENMLSDRASINRYEQLAGGQANTNKIIDATSTIINNNEQLLRIRQMQQNGYMPNVNENDGKVYYVKGNNIYDENLNIVGKK